MLSVRLPESSLPSGLDPIGLVVHHGPELIEVVRNSRTEAVHYDGFQVGALSVAGSMSGDIGVFGSANQNLQPGDNDTKACAETTSLQKLAAADMAYAVTMFVCGMPQPDTQSGVSSPTLHCCGLCRDRMTELPQVREDTVVVSIHPDKDVYQWLNFGELMSIHKGTLPPDYQTHEDPGFERWREGGAHYDRWLSVEEQTPLLISRLKLAEIAITWPLEEAA